MQYYYSCQGKYCDIGHSKIVVHSSVKSVLDLHFDDDFNDVNHKLILGWLCQTVHQANCHAWHIVGYIVISSEFYVNLK